MTWFASLYLEGVTGYPFFEDEADQAIDEPTTWIIKFRDGPALQGFVTHREEQFYMKPSASTASLYKEALNAWEKHRATRR